MKRIAIFSDGTWNSPQSGATTNVLQMARAVCPDVAGVKQVVFYDWGIGTDRKPLSGALTGAGIDKNIMDCYRFLVHNYDPGDQLFFFGFSRGAYTVRSLAGFIRNCGLLQRKHARRIAEAFRLYRKRSRASSPSEALATRFRRDFAVADLTPIEFVGAWDTVGALGIPVPFWGALNDREFLFHDTEPSKIVQHARHALSIDENREDFAPVLWSDKPGVDLQQVWFAGAHGDVGGTYRERGLSDCASRWMLREACKFGLRFEAHYLQAVEPRPGGKQHNARKGIYLARSELVRTVVGPLHISVKRRWDGNAHGYRAKSKALQRLLATVGGDWNRITIVADSQVPEL